MMLARMTPSIPLVLMLTLGVSVGQAGSLVGYLPAPFAEQRLVRNGRQSMPLEYNNVRTPYSSETERTWDKSQNWTVHGVDTRTLYLYGQTANAADKLYVAVEDAAGHVGIAIHPDAAVLATAQWTEGRIPLSSLAGVNAAQIKKMVVGAGSRTNPVKAGTGRIYIDDIGIRKP